MGETHASLDHPTGQPIPHVGFTHPTETCTRTIWTVSTAPVRLKADEWQSGDINWLLDVIAPNKKATGNMIANFMQVVKDGDLRLHPIVTRLVDAETLEKMGASKVDKE